MNIAVIGMGKIGLPLAVQYSKKGHRVIGVDINPLTVELINSGKEPFPEEHNLQEFLSEVVANNVLVATSNYQEALEKADAVVVVVPLFVDVRATPDFSSLDFATNEIGKYIKKNTLVCYETTLPISTTRNRFTPMLEKNSGLKVGQDFYVVFSPERVLTGRVFQDLRKYPKIVGGVTANCTLLGKQFYENVIDFDPRLDLDKPNGVWCLTSSDAAEFVKLAETTYRDVNIGLANQFAMFADQMNLDIYEVISAANSQSFSHIHQPGVAVGGHCIPIYPQFYLWSDPSASIVRSARLVNSQMPNYVAMQAHEILKDQNNKNILILGASYRNNVKEVAFSGAYSLQSALRELDYHVEVYDPLYSREELSLHGFAPMDSRQEDFALVIIQNESVVFKSMLGEANNWPSLRAILDGRNLFKGISPIPGLPLIGIGIRDTSSTQL